MKKILIGAVIIVLLIAAAAAYQIVLNDPNFRAKHFQDELSVDETHEVNFDYQGGFLRKKAIPVFSFTPDEDAEYTITISDITSNSDIIVEMQVMDTDLTDYLNINNVFDRIDIKEDSEDDLGIGDSFAGTVLLTKGDEYFLIFEMDFASAAGAAEANEKLSGSFNITISKSVEETIEELTVDKPVSMTVKTNGQTCALFRPEASGFYKFTSNIASKNKSGYSTVSSVTSAQNKNVEISDGICYLEAGIDYYIWASVYELRDNSADVDLSCKAIESVKAEGYTDVTVTTDTMIEYKADSDKLLAVFSESDGDPSATVYDSEGFPVSTDDDSGMEFSGNEKDFALVMVPEKGKSYMIYVDGIFTECRINIAEYTGDGTTLGPDDIKKEASDE